MLILTLSLCAIVTQGSFSYQWFIKPLPITHSSFQNVFNIKAFRCCPLCSVRGCRLLQLPLKRELCTAVDTEHSHVCNDQSSGETHDLLRSEFLFVFLMMQQSDIANGHTLFKSILCRIATHSKMTLTCKQMCQIVEDRQRAVGSQLHSPTVCFRAP